MESEVAAARNAFQRATETTLFLRAALPAELRHPKVAIVCGSGLGGLAETIHAEPRMAMAYENIPNFPRSTGEWIDSRVVDGCRAVPFPLSLLFVFFASIWIEGVSNVSE